MKKLVVIVLSLFLSACQATFKNSELMSAIELSEASPIKGVKGNFELTILAVGQQSNKIYLNSQQDYRDRRNVSVVMPKHLIDGLIEEYGEAPASFFMNKTIKVKGIAKRVKIWLVEKNKSPTKYYYQTHINITNIGQIKMTES